LPVALIAAAPLALPGMPLGTGINAQRLRRDRRQHVQISWAKYHSPITAAWTEYRAGRSSGAT